VARDAAGRFAAQRRACDEEPVTGDELAELGRLLAEEAALGVPPETAETVRRARELGPTAAPFLAQEAERGRSGSLLALEALRVADPKAYAAVPAAERAAIYARALRDSPVFNAWGVPGMQLTSTAQALIALGDDAVDALRPLLQDERPALLEGSQDATTSRYYANRVRDYALVLIDEILGLPYSYDVEPEARDAQIARLEARLTGG
jgi:hypothetical protein